LVLRQHIQLCADFHTFVFPPQKEPNGKSCNVHKRDFRSSCWIDTSRVSVYHRGVDYKTLSIRVVCDDLARVLPGIAGVLLWLLLRIQWRFILEHDCQVRWVFLPVAISLFTLRMVEFKMSTPVYLVVTESECWIFSVLAFGCKYLNRPSSGLSYLSQAAYPVYIIHMIILYGASALIFPLDIEVTLQFALVMVLTFAGCFAVYEFAIRRVSFIRPLFGLKRGALNAVADYAVKKAQA
jgi:hypothetical protein